MAPRDALLAVNGFLGAGAGSAVSTAGAFFLRLPPEDHPSRSWARICSRADGPSPSNSTSVNFAALFITLTPCAFVGQQIIPAASHVDARVLGGRAEHTG